MSSLSRRAWLRAAHWRGRGHGGPGARGAGVRGSSGGPDAGRRPARAAGLRAAQHAPRARDARGAGALPGDRRPHAPHVPRAQRGRCRTGRGHARHRHAARSAAGDGPSQRADDGESHRRSGQRSAGIGAHVPAATRRGSSSSPSRRGIGLPSPATRSGRPTSWVAQRPPARGASRS